MARYGEPTIALRFFPWDAKAHERRADLIFSSGMADHSWPAAEGEARQALIRSPLSPVAARVLGFTSELRGDRERGRKLVLQAAALTRRDLTTRLWLIEDAVSRSDVRGALDQFDIALRRSRPARDLLFPILGRAAADPALVGPITDLLARSPNWAAEFLQSAIADGAATENIADMLTHLPNVKALNGDLRQQVIQQLVKEERFAAARRANNRFLRTRTGNVADTKFRSVTGYQPFLWTVSNEASRGASMEDGLDFYAEGGDGGVVANQLLTLSPGRYRLFSVGQTDPSAEGGATWFIRCGKVDGPILTQIKMPSQLGPVSSDFDVGPECAGQWLILHVSGGTTARGTKGHIQMVDVGSETR